MYSTRVIIASAILFAVVAALPQKKLDDSASAPDYTCSNGGRGQLVLFQSYSICSWQWYSIDSSMRHLVDTCACCDDFGNTFRPNYEDNCGTYTQSANGLSGEFSCARLGLKFDVKTCSCNWPSEVSCSCNADGSGGKYESSIPICPCYTLPPLITDNYVYFLTDGN